MSAVASWSADQLVYWLFHHNLTKHIDKFLHHRITGSELCSLLFPKVDKQSFKERYDIDDDEFLEQLKEQVAYLGYSQVYDIGVSRFVCAYCNVGINECYTAKSLRLTVADYEELHNHAWLRSGTLLYHPINSKCCCPHYQIRLPVSEFKPSRSQRRVLTKMEAFLCGKPRSQKHKATSGSSMNHQTKNNSFILREKLQKLVIQAVLKLNISEEIKEKAIARLSLKQRPQFVKPPATIAFTTGIASHIAALNTREQLMSKEYKADRQTAIKTQAKTIANDLISHIESLQKSMSPDYKLNLSTTEDGLLLIQVNGKTGTSETPVKQTKPVVANETEKHDFTHKLEVTFRRPEFSQEVYNLYQRYQLIRHNQQETAQFFTSFICETPLIPEEDPTGELPGYGTFHVHYRLDETLIAVAVVDILPQTFESVYFFWDPDFEFLNLGTYSALNEIRFCQQRPKLKYYCLGWYIHTCRKVAYKVSFQPTEILCPITYNYVRYQDVKHLLDEYGYCQLAKSTSVTPQPDVDSFIILAFGGFHRFGELKEFLDQSTRQIVQAELEAFASFLPPSLYFPMDFTLAEATSPPILVIMDSPQLLLAQNNRWIPITVFLVMWIWNRSASIFKIQPQLKRCGVKIFVKEVRVFFMISTSYRT